MKFRKLKVDDKVRQQNKSKDITFADYITVTSSKFSRNSGTIRILSNFLVKNHGE